MECKYRFGGSCHCSLNPFRPTCIRDIYEKCWAELSKEGKEAAARYFESIGKKLPSGDLKLYM